MKTLSITNSKLTSFPGSVGRLEKLEELDLSNNRLKSLPITLAFCKKLKTLDLHKNSFRQLPGVVQRLSNLTTLRRLQNPLTPIYESYGPRYTKKFKKTTDTNKTTDTKVYQPISLQACCTTVIFTSQVDYWATNAIGPLQCKTLDRLAEQFTICDNCNRMLPEQGMGELWNLRIYQPLVGRLKNIRKVTFGTSKLVVCRFLLCPLSEGPTVYAVHKAHVGSTTCRDFLVVL